MTEHALDAATREFLIARRVDPDRALPATLAATRDQLRSAIAAYELARVEELQRLEAIAGRAAFEAPPPALEAVR
jgi:hypothetical protein